MTVNQKIMCAVLLFAVWVGFVSAGLAPVSDLIAAVRDALMALGIFSATLTNPKD